MESLRNMDVKNKEKIIYDKIMELKNGDNQDQSLAFECIGILGNESTPESFDSRLDIVNDMIDEYYSKKETNK